jgi:hypothetical protein
MLQGGMTHAGGERPKVPLVHWGRLWLAKLQERGDVPHLPARKYVADSQFSETSDKTHTLRARSSVA